MIGRDASTAARTRTPSRRKYRRVGAYSGTVQTRPGRSTGIRPGSRSASLPHQDHLGELLYMARLQAQVVGAGAQPAAVGAGAVPLHLVAAHRLARAHQLTHLAALQVEERE